MKPSYRDIDYQKCVKNIGNSFDLVIVASQRARELKRNKGGNESFVATALKEIQDGKISKEDFAKSIVIKKKK